MYPLLIGLAFLLLFDVRPVVYKRYKKWQDAQRERKEWAQNIEQRLRRTNIDAQSHVTLLEGTQLRELRRAPTAGMGV